MNGQRAAMSLERWLYRKETDAGKRTLSGGEPGTGGSWTLGLGLGITCYYPHTLSTQGARILGRNA